MYAKVLAITLVIENETNNRSNLYWTKTDYCTTYSIVPYIIQLFNRETQTTIREPAAVQVVGLRGCCLTNCFKTGPVQCLRGISHRLMFLTIIYGRSHAD